MLKSGSWKIGLAAVCLALALGLVFFLERDGNWRKGMESAGKTAPVTKPFPRDQERPGGRELPTKNPREDFDAARNRGLTEQEVRWIIEDFMNLGIDNGTIALGSAKDYYKTRVRRHEWLLDAMTSGFALSAGQKDQASASLKAHGERDLAEFVEYVSGIKSFEADGKEYRVVDGSKVRKLTDASYWLRDPECAPWNLTDLSEGQKDMTRFRNEEGRLIWIREGSRTLDYGTDEKYEASGDAFMTDPMVMNGGGWFFPLSIGQVEGMIGAKVDQASKAPEGKGKVTRLELVKFLTAPQLKTLLLFEPDLAKHLMEELGE